MIDLMKTKMYNFVDVHYYIIQVYMYHDYNSSFKKTDGVFCFALSKAS